MHKTRLVATLTTLCSLSVACATETGEAKTETPPKSAAAEAEVLDPAPDARDDGSIATPETPDDGEVADVDDVDEVEEESVVAIAEAPEGEPDAAPDAAPPPPAEPSPIVGANKGGSKADKRVPNSRGMPRPHRKVKKTKPRGPGGTMGGFAERPSTEDYEFIAENDFITTADDARSTFSIDVDTASYSNTRRFLTSGSLPPVDSVRIEELINYFEYEYAAPETDDPFSMTAEVASCPWDETHRLVHVGLQGKMIDQQDVPARNLVFLFDVSGSMNSPDKLPLLQRAFSLLTDNLRPKDTVSIVVYAGASGVVLPPTSGKNKRKILEALDQLRAGGSTNGGQGIELAYKLAAKSFVKGGINRVILATDGDFNVGTTSQSELVRLIEKKRKTGVFLSVLGFGSGNLKDSTMESLANKGNGNYAYIDSVNEARKVLVEQAGATLVTIAKDVKIQVEFNPAEVSSYRLIGYENRKLAHTDFNDDTKDAGEIGAGHSVTALYEVIPTGTPGPGSVTDELKYQKSPELTAAAGSGELMNVNIRYKQPNGSKSKLLTFPVTDADARIDEASRDFRFSAAVAGFGMLLRDSKHKGDATFASVKDLAVGATGKDPNGYRREFVKLVGMAAKLKR